MKTTSRRKIGRALAAALLLAGASAPIFDQVAVASPGGCREIALATDFRIRVTAALALGKSTDACASRALVEALGDPHPAVRAAAAAALGALGDPTAIPALQKAADGEGTTSARGQIERTIERLRALAPPAVPARFLIRVGRLDNTSGVTQSAALNAFRVTTRTQLARIAGAEVLSDDVDPAVARTSRKLPVYTFDGTLTRLAREQSGSSVSYSARVEYLLREVPDQALKGSISGHAQALAEVRFLRSAKELAQLQVDAVSGAVESAMKGVTPALEEAVKTSRKAPPGR